MACLETQGKHLFTSICALLITLCMKKHHEEHHEEHHEQHEENQAAPPSGPGYERREVSDFVGLDARDLDAYDYFYGRDFDVLEGRSAGKVLLGAGLGAFAVHEWDKHEKVGLPN